MNRELIIKLEKLLSDGKMNMSNWEDYTFIVNQNNHNPFWSDSLELNERLLKLIDKIEG